MAGSTMHVMSGALRRPCLPPHRVVFIKFGIALLRRAASALASADMLGATDRTAEQIATDADLADLRQLTPEQEAAAAKAAQHIEEVAAAAEAAPEEERWDDGKWDRLGGGAIEPLFEHTPLIDLEYLVALAEGGGVMPCGRQNVPPAAFITARNLWRLKLWGKVKDKYSLGVLVLSYPWLDWFHPDRLGAQLRRLLPFLKAMLAEAKRDSPHCTVGVMIDFLCLPQKPFATEEDGARSRVSLKAQNEWYFHPFTYTLLAAVPGCDRLTDRIGWDLVHQSASFVVKHPHCLLDFDGYEGATEFGGAFGSSPETCSEQMKLKARAPPIAPDVFEERMREAVAYVGSGGLKFTSNAEMELAIGQYEAGFIAAINHVAADSSDVNRVLVFFGLGWGDNEAAQLLRALRYAAAKCTFPLQHEDSTGAIVSHIKICVGTTTTYEGGNHDISEEAMATLPPVEVYNEDTGEWYAVDWGTPSDARYAWKGKFSLYSTSRIEQSLMERAAAERANTEVIQPQP